MTDPHAYTCAHCGGTFTSGRPDDASHAEAVELWGVRGDAPASQTPGGEGMAEICDPCWREFMAWYRKNQERVAMEDV